jgi:large subunit ribosomal protein L17
MALYRNLVTDLLRYEKIVTTEAKAKETRPLAEKVITLGKKGNLHARRQALAFIYDTKVVDKIFTELGPRYSSRQGGYTRVIKLGPRSGDGAPMAQLELV